MTSRSSFHHRIALGALALSVTTILAGCTAADPLAGGGESGDPQSITVGSQGFPESDVLGQIYGQLLEANGYAVDYEIVGSREAFMTALGDGSIDLIADYSGNLLAFADPAATATSSDDVEAALPAALEPLGFAVAAAAPAEDSDALVVTPEFAAANDLSAIGDLAALSGSITLGANTEFDSRWAGQLQSVYGVGYTFKAIDDFGGPATLDDLLKGNIQVADIYTTTPSIKQNNLVVLEDDLNLFAAQNIIPLLNADVVSAELIALLDEVSAKLTTEELLNLNEISAGDDKPAAADVAREWLQSNGFLG